MVACKAFLFMLCRLVGTCLNVGLFLYVWVVYMYILEAHYFPSLRNCLHMSSLILPVFHS